MIKFKKLTIALLALLCISATAWADEQPNGLEVTITGTSAEGQQATFEMPQYDVTATYTLKRDMTVDVSAEVGDGSDGYRIRIKKKEGTGKYDIASGLPEDYPNIQDKLDAQNPFEVAAKDYELILQKKGDGDTWTNTPDYSVGTFRFEIVGKEDYAGTIYSNEFVLFEGYELTIPAGEYATYYKDEALYVEDADAQLYTIAQVANETATAVEVTVAAKNTPILVKNNADTEKTILLIPTTEDVTEVTVYDGFKGTLTATEIAASTSTQNNYAFNGKQFVWVKDAITVGANKAWLSINTGVSSARITLVFDETTKIANTNITNITNGNWYTIDGRKVNAPSKKGIYIMNGKKVVVK